MYDLRLTSAAFVLAGLSLAGCGQEASTVLAAVTSSPAPAATTTAPADVDCQLGGSGDDRADLKGQSLENVRRSEMAQGHKVRVIGSDGECLARTDDLNTKRVNVSTREGLVIWARMG